MAEREFPDEINFDYIKTSNFRVVHSDGAFVGAKPGGLTVTFYSERQPIPRRVVHKVSEDGRLGLEIKEKRVVRDAIVRDAEIAVTMTLDNARSLIRVLENIVKSSAEAKSKKAKP